MVKIRTIAIDFAICLLWFGLIVSLVSLNYVVNLGFDSETAMIVSSSTLEEISKFSAFLFCRRLAFQIVLSYGVFEALFIKLPIFEWTSAHVVGLYFGFAFAGMAFHASTAFLYRAAIQLRDNQFLCGFVVIAALIHVAYNMLASWISNEIFALICCWMLVLFIVILHYTIRRFSNVRVE